jgi:flagellar assembly protein FliH
MQTLPEGERGPQAVERTNAAGEIVERAQERAEELLRAGIERASAVQQDAYRDGREIGYRDGLSVARAEVADTLALVQAAARQAKQLRDRLLFNSEHEMVELVIACVQAILGEQVQLQPSLVLDTVERALKRAGAQNVVRLRVHPADLELVSAELEHRLGEGVAGWQIVADGAVSVGGCVIHTEAGEVDARLDVQLEEIARTFRAARGLDASARPSAGAQQEASRRAA